MCHADISAASGALVSSQCLTFVRICGMEMSEIPSSLSPSMAAWKKQFGSVHVLSSCVCSANFGSAKGPSQFFGSARRVLRSSLSLIASGPSLRLAVAHVVITLILTYQLSM